jgi:uncharacterized linocin/CFP29 family protein
MELRATFEVSRAELADLERGAADVDLGPLDDAARRLAAAENAAVFHGLGAAGISGVAQASTQQPVVLSEDCDLYPRAVAQAVASLRQEGVGGPYGLAVSPDIHTNIVETSEHGGYPLLEHLTTILGGPVVWAPGLQGALVLSQRGGDFLFDCGQDISIGYDHHDANGVHLYLEAGRFGRAASLRAGSALLGQKDSPASGPSLTAIPGPQGFSGVVPDGAGLRMGS